MYFHFPGGKAQLGAEALALAGRRLGAAISRTIEKAPDVPSAITALAGLLASGLEASGYELGCPIATTALETAATSELIGTAANDAFASWLGALEARLTANGVPEAQARRDAVLVLSALEGALILARTARDKEPLEIVGEDLAAYFSARMAR